MRDSSWHSRACFKYIQTVVLLLFCCVSFGRNLCCGVVLDLTSIRTCICKREKLDNNCRNKNVKCKIWKQMFCSRTFPYNVQCLIYLIICRDIVLRINS